MENLYLKNANEKTIFNDFGSGFIVITLIGLCVFKKGPGIDQG